MHDEEKQRNYELAEKLISQQNFSAAVVGGALATLVAAAAYGFIVSDWPFTYGFAAAGIGIVVGLPMGLLGRGISMKFSVAAAIYTTAGCILGNLCVRIVNLAQATLTSPVEVFRSLSLAELADRLAAGLALHHLVYWFVAVVCAAFLAKRPLSRSDRLAIGLYEMRG